MEGIGTPQKTIKSINLYTWSFPEFEPPTKDQRPSPFSALHICSRCAAWSSYGSPNNWSRVLAWLYWLPVDPVPLNRLYLASMGDVPIDAVNWGSRVSWFSGKGGEWKGGTVRGGQGELGGKWDCDWDVRWINKLINRKENIFHACFSSMYV